VVGVDVSPSMLAEAHRNCAEQGIENVRLVGPGLGPAIGMFDFVHSFTVFQHIPAPEGERILSDLLAHLEPGGLGALHFTTAQRASPLRRFVRRLRWTTPAMHALANLLKGRPGEPLMIMDHYDLGRIWNVLHAHGCDRAHVLATDHGGQLGVLIFFEKT
jgi:SAM-dependent methyltransferase